MTPEGLKEVSERNPEGISNWKQQEVFLEFPNRMELVCLSNARKLLWLEWRGGGEVKVYCLEKDCTWPGGVWGLFCYNEVTGMGNVSLSLNSTRST